jgi:hypothetical protein
MDLGGALAEARIAGCHSTRINKKALSDSLSLCMVGEGVEGDSLQCFSCEGGAGAGTGVERAGRLNKN